MFIFHLLSDAQSQISCSQRPNSEAAPTNIELQRWCSVQSATGDWEPHFPAKETVMPPLPEVINFELISNQHPPSLISKQFSSGRRSLSSPRNGFLTVPLPLLVSSFLGQKTKQRPQYAAEIAKKQLQRRCGKAYSVQSTFFWERPTCYANFRGFDLFPIWLLGGRWNDIVKERPLI